MNTEVPLRGEMASLFLQETARLQSLPADQSWGYLALGAVSAGVVVGTTWALSHTLVSVEPGELDPLVKATEQGCRNGD